MTEYKKPVAASTSAIGGSSTYIKVLDVDTMAKVAHVVDQLGKPMTVSLTRSYGKQYNYPNPGEEWIATREFGDWVLTVYINNELSEVESPSIHPGLVMLWAGVAIPAGWYLADGSAKSRTLDSALFAAIGVTYGAGDGTTTFNLPNLPPNASLNYIIKN